MGTFHITSPRELSYVHIPRSGMAMKKIISDWLKPNFSVIDSERWMIDHPNLQTVREHIPSGKTMTVVRNPWQRLYSFYTKISTEGYWLDWNGQTLMDLKPLDDWIEDYCNPEITFNFPRWFDRFTNQVDFLNYQGEWVDFICRAEHLEQDFVQVQEYLECSSPLPDISGYNHYEFKHHMSDKSIQMIAEIFKRDLDYFGYQVI